MATVIRDQKFSISCSGLKPSTIHYFYWGSQNRSANCVPSGGTMGDPLISGNDGTLNFDFYYSSGLSSNSVISSSQRNINNLTSNKAYTIMSSDGVSQATGTIFVPSTTSNSTLGLKTNITKNSLGNTIFTGPPKTF